MEKKNYSNPTLGAQQTSYNLKAWKQGIILPFEKEKKKKERKSRGRKMGSLTLMKILLVMLLLSS